VLLIEDDPDVADSFATLLGSLGHDVRILREGSQAPEVVRDYRPDFVFVDIAIPEVDGYEVAKRLRAGSGPHPAALIALTGYGQAADVQRAREAGFDRHLTKPARVEDLEAILAGTDGGPENR
jgi:CheY-like chemotaxis protein